MMHAVPSLKSLSELLILALYFIIRGCEAANEVVVYEQAELKPPFCDKGADYLTLMCGTLAQRKNCKTSSTMVKELECTNQDASLYSLQEEENKECEIMLLVCPLTCSINYKRAEPLVYDVELALGRSPYSENNVVKFTKEKVGDKTFWEPEGDLIDFMRYVELLKAQSSGPAEGEKKTQA